MFFYFNRRFFEERCDLNAFHSGLNNLSADYRSGTNLKINFSSFDYLGAVAFYIHRRTPIFLRFVRAIYIVRRVLVT